jgi:hypothetical protein
MRSREKLLEWGEQKKAKRAWHELKVLNYINDHQEQGARIWHFRQSREPVR